METRLDKRSLEKEHLCFQGINFTGALLALAALHSGIRVSVCLNKPLNLDYEPELIANYTLNLFKLPRTLANIYFLEKIASFFPSLVTNQRVLTLFEANKIGAKRLILTDLLLKRDRDEASLPIRFSNYEQYRTLAEYYINGALIPEFQFDRNMALFFLLEEIKKHGAEISYLHQTEGDRGHCEKTIRCLENNREKQEIVIEEGEVHFTNNLLIVNAYFETTLQKKDNKRVVGFRFKKPISESLFIEKALIIIKSLGVSSPEIYRSKLLSIFKSAVEEMTAINSNLLVIRDTDFLKLHGNCKKLTRKISSKLGKKIALEKWLKSLNRVHLDGHHFREQQRVCDEKFDLAKQTGIEYRRFCYYFFRYSTIIDELIELAYEQMASYRTNPEALWQKIENDYLESYQKNSLGNTLL